MRGRTSLSAAIGLAALLSLASLVGGTAATSWALGSDAAFDATFDPPQADIDRFPRSSDVSETASRLSAIGESDSNFAGVYGSTDGKLHLALVAGASTSAYDNVVLEKDVVIDRVRNSKAALDALADAVVGDKGSLAAKGLFIQRVAVALDQNRVVIGMSSGSATVRNQLEQRYPGVAVAQVSATAPQDSVATRLNDVAPWNGGDFISNGLADHTCTSGMPAHRSSDNFKFLITAGHCFPASQFIYNKSTAYQPNGGGGGTMGYVAYNDFVADNTLDAELIYAGANGGSSNRIFRSDTVSAIQQSWNNLVQNTGGVCISGAFDGEYCTLTVTNSDLPCDYYGGLYKQCHAARLVDYNHLVAGGGDSGAAIYDVDPNTLKLNVHAIFNSTIPVATCVRYPQAGPGVENTRNCGHEIWGTELVPVLQKYGLTLNL